MDQPGFTAKESFDLVRLEQTMQHGSFSPPPLGASSLPRQVARLADLAKYKPVSATESRTEPGKPSKELFKGYDDLERVRIGLRNKPDDICKPVLKEPSKNSPDLDKYGPVYFNEPDGRQDWTAEEVSSQNEALDQYKKLHQYTVCEDGVSLSMFLLQGQVMFGFRVEAGLVASWGTE
ncbi:hypothetical protein OCS_00466 [Ophiocordyceps sinensis CO18]|uniref:Uncharacterized protein n=1 Tax=Ophiocordyceps sinensis (strain Co18 / CGMCC 3.14243) TaxID=911162 RepID=T5APT0_OPHSC|nr:hypothetical protein OCS_00466 [Ophiocordyceps sinensis CO18]